MGDYSDQLKDQRNPKFWAFRLSNQVSYDLVLPVSGASSPDAVSRESVRGEIDRNSAASDGVSSRVGLGKG